MRRPRSTTDHDACDVINEDDKEGAGDVVKGDDEEGGGEREGDINKGAERGRGGGGGRSAL